MRLSIVLAALTGQLDTDMKRAEQIVRRRSKEIEDRARRAGSAIGKALGAGVVVGVGAATVAMAKAIEQADKLGETAEKLGVSVESFTSLGFAAKMSGLEIDKFGASIRAFNSRVETTEPLLNSLGVTTRDASGVFRSSTDIIRDLGDVFQALPEGIEQSQLAAELFGTKLGAEMIPVLNRGTEGIAALEAEARSLGGVLTKEGADAAGAFNDELDRLQIAINGALVSILPQATGALKEFTSVVTDPGFVDGVKSFVGVIGDLISGFGIIISQAGKAKMALTSFGSGQTDEQLETRLAALQTRISAARKASGGELPSNFEITMPDVARALAEREKIIREISRRARADGVGVGTPSAQENVNDPAKAIDALRAAMAKQQQDAQNAQSARKAAADAAKQQEKAERELAAAVDAEAKAMEEARRKQIDAENELAESIARAADAREYAMQQGRDLVSDLEFELELMKMTNAERATALQIRGMDAEAISKYGEEIAALNGQIEANIKVTEQMDGLRQATSNLFEGLISGTMSAKDAFRSFVDDILANITRMIANNFAQSLFGGMGQSGGGMFGDVLNGVFGSLFGGGLAGGGPVSGGTPYIVGENGPELFIPKSSGRIANNAEVRGMGRGGTTINISVEGQVDMRSRQQLAADVGRESQKALARTG